MNKEKILKVLNEKSNSTVINGIIFNNFEITNEMDNVLLIKGSFIIKMMKNISSNHSFSIIINTKRVDDLSVCFEKEYDDNDDMMVENDIKENVERYLESHLSNILIENEFEKWFKENKTLI